MTDKLARLLEAELGDEPCATCGEDPCELTADAHWASFDMDWDFWGPECETCGGDCVL